MGAADADSVGGPVRTRSGRQRRPRLFFHDDWHACADDVELCSATAASATAARPPGHSAVCTAARTSGNSNMPVGSSWLLMSSLARQSGQGHGRKREAGRAAQRPPASRDTLPRKAQGRAGSGVQRAQNLGAEASLAPPLSRSTLAWMPLSHITPRASPPLAGTARLRTAQDPSGRQDPARL